MAKSREELQMVLESILGSRNVYFQPPESFKLSYPCIVYELGNVSMLYANDKPYLHDKSYTVTLIDGDPDSELVLQLLLQLPYCDFDRYYAADNLNHWVFTLFY